MNEIRKVQGKNQFLLTTMEDLYKDADRSALETADEKDFKLLERSNDLISAVKNKMKVVE